MIRKPRSADKYGFFGRKAWQTRCPAFGLDQITPSDLDALIRIIKDDYAQARPGEMAH